MAVTEQAEESRPLLELDPELGTGLPDGELSDARSSCRLPLVRLGPGLWSSLGELAGRDDVVGCLVADGLLCREVAFRESHMLELLGHGDVVLPPPASEWPRLGGNTAVTAIEPTTMMVLGPSFARAAARWPSLLVNIHRRLEHQRERLAVQGLIAHFPQAEHRLLLQLWHLATWWGRVTPDGMTVPFKLTHDLLGRLIAARRPTVTLAARELQVQGYVKRGTDGTWILTNASEAAVRALIGTGRVRVVGEALITRQRSQQIAATSQALREQARGMRSAGARRRAADSGS